MNVIKVGDKSYEEYNQKNAILEYPKAPNSATIALYCEVRVFDSYDFKYLLVAAKLAISAIIVPNKEVNASVSKKKNGLNGQTGIGKPNTFTERSGMPERYDRKYPLI